MRTDAFLFCALFFLSQLLEKKIGQKFGVFVNFDRKFRELRT